MEKRLLIYSNIILVLLAVIFSVVFLCFPNIYKLNIDYINENGFDDSIKSHIRSERLLTDSMGNPHDLRLEFPSNVQLDKIKTEENYMERTNALYIRGIDEMYYMDFPIIGKCDGIRDIIYYSRENTGVMEIFTQDVRVLRTTMEDRFLYLDFIPPEDIYDKIVVIDPGHGGTDIGTVNGNIAEKDINIKIALQLYDMLKDEEGLGVFITRLGDETVPRHARIDMANNIQADLFVSIHQNSTASGRISDINGTEVMYFNADIDGNSKKLAEKLQKNLVNKLGSRDRGLVPGDNIEVLRKANCPAALVEVGFMSNPAELRKLNSEKYQRDCANALYTGIMESLNENTNSDRE